MKILNTIIVGVGGRGNWPLRLCKPENGFQIVGLCDIDLKALSVACDITNLSQNCCYEDYDRLLEEIDFDCVIICTPTIFHVPMVKKAIQRGFPVLVEKGMAPDWDSACDVVCFSKANNGIFCVSQNYRYNSVERTIQRLLSNPEDPFYLGCPFLLDYVHHRVRPFPQNLNYPFASVWDMSCHHFDNLLFWFGSVEEVTAHSFAPSWSHYKYQNNNCALVRFSNGVVVNYIHTHDASRGEFGLSLHGERGALVGRVLDRTSTTSGLVEMTFSPRPQTQFGLEIEKPVPFSPNKGESGVLEDFYGYIVHNREPGISGYNNLEVMALCQMVVSSIRGGKTVSRSELPFPQNA